MRVSHFERWMFRLGVAGAVATLGVMAVRARSVPPAIPAAALVDSDRAQRFMLPVQHQTTADPIPHVYTGQPVSPGWANRIVDSVNRSETRLATMEHRPPEPPLEHHAFDVRDPSTLEWTNRVVDKVNSVDARLGKVENAKAESETAFYTGPLPGIYTVTDGVLVRMPAAAPASP